MKNQASTLMIALLLLLGNPALAEQADDNWDDDWAEEETSDSWHGFVEGAFGSRLQNDPALDQDYPLSEVRLQLETSGYNGDNRYVVKGDLYYDDLLSEFRADLREASYSFRVNSQFDLKLGQQILTWGTGDLVFLNDMFPKDWKSFFAGRDTEYLKAPVFGVKASYFGEAANLDLVWVPLFTADRYIDGDRFSWFSPQAGQNVASPAGHIDGKEPSETLDNGEFAARVYGTVNSNEWALYGYHGFNKQPNAVDSSGNPYFSALDVLGASIRGNVGQGLGNAEIALHLGEDSDGSDPLIANDQFRLLLGYERELLPRLTMGLQYYLEQTLNYDELLANSASPYLPEQYRYLYTLRLNYRMMQDNLNWSLFSYYSPSDDDHFIRPSVSYRFDDNLSMTLGANLFGGDKTHTFFGQFEDASSVYGRLRYAF